MGLKKHHPPSSSPSSSQRPVRRDPERNFKGFVAQLDDPNPAVRRWGARDLAAFPEAAPILCRHLAKETDPTVREAVFSSLLRIGTEEAVTGLLPFLRSEDAGLRNGAIEVLQQLPDQTARHIEALLQDQDSDVRIFAIDILQTLAHPDTLGWLEEVLNHEEHVNVLATAVDRLAELTLTPGIKEALARLKQRFANEPYLTFAIDAVLARASVEDSQ